MFFKVYEIMILVSAFENHKNIELLKYKIGKSEISHKKIFPIKSTQKMVIFYFLFLILLL